jgi:hypothetical protein
VDSGSQEGRLCTRLIGIGFMSRVGCSVKVLSLGGLKCTPHQVRREHIPILRDAMRARVLPESVPTELTSSFHVREDLTQVTRASG